MNKTMDKLPHDIIMRIIKEADGGLWIHKFKFSQCLEVIEDCGKDMEECGLDGYSDEFFEILWGSFDLTKRVHRYRMSMPNCTWASERGDE